MCMLCSLAHMEHVGDHAHALKYSGHGLVLSDIGAAFFGGLWVGTWSQFMKPTDQSTDQSEQEG